MKMLTKGAINTVANLAEFKQLVAGPTPVLVDFSAQWCGPCKAIFPVLTKLAAANEEITFVKIDVDEHPDVAQQYGVTAMPTFMLFKAGEKKGEMKGANASGLKNLVTMA